MGLLALLDEESNFPKATDQSLIGKFSMVNIIIITFPDSCIRLFFTTVTTIILSLSIMSIIDGDLLTERIKIKE